jgi:lysophospholipase L1-like esterase
LPYILSQYAITGLDRFEPRKFINHKLFDLDARIRKEFAGVAGVHYVSVLDSICGQGRCLYLLDGSVPMQWDNHHLTKEGSVLVAEKLLPVIAASLDSKL